MRVMPHTAQRTRACARMRTHDALDEGAVKLGAELGKRALELGHAASAHPRRLDQPAERLAVALLQRFGELDRVFEHRHDEPSAQQAVERRVVVMTIFTPLPHTSNARR
jgi:hypothetical protein